MAQKRVLVPAALHAELTEYTNLIRVLRTSRVLDLTAHLLEHAAQHRQEDDQARAREDGKGKGGRARDTWTPWPLLDSTVPEWRFDDEIEMLAETVVRQLSTRDVAGESQVDRDGDGDDDDDDVGLDPLSPQSTRLLVEHMGSFLVHILNLMADQRPSTSGSMQNRLWAMNWEDVISTIAVNGLVDESVITHAQKRLERIYGASHTKAIERMHVAASAKSKFERMVSTDDDLMLQPPIHRPQKRRKKKERRIVSKAIIDSDTGDDTLV